MSDTIIDVSKSNEISYTIETNERRKNKTGDSAVNTVFICCGSIAILSLVLGLIAAVVCYYYFGIKFLIDYENVNSECNSNIWDYVLVSLILSFFLGGSSAQSAKNEDSKSSACAGIIISFVWLGIGIWGILESNNESCQEIRNSQLWTFAHVISIIQTVLGSILSLVWCCIGALT